MQNKLCANYGITGECCTPDWDARVDVILCDDSGHGGSFYVYQFDEPPGCPMAICVEDHPVGEINENLEIVINVLVETYHTQLFTKTQ